MHPFCMIINCKIISFGICDKDENDGKEKLCNILCKILYIFVKYRKTIPRCELFKTYILKRIQIEKEIALMNDKFPKFGNKCRLFRSYLTY